jgi:hypothetical protein
VKFSTPAVMRSQAEGGACFSLPRPQRTACLGSRRCSSRVHSTTPPAAASGMGSGSRWENNNRAECPFYAALDQVVEARPVLDASLNWGSDLHHSCAITSN